MNSNDSNDVNLTWGQRNGLTVMLIAMGVSLLLVIAIQILRR